jgi:GcrA cell cycle regulator
MTNLPSSNERYWGPSGHMVNNPKWDADRMIDELKRLHNEGFSAGKIAKKLGFSSRNAVIGKLHRLGIVKSRPVGQRAHIERPALSRGEKIAKGLYDYSTTKRINEQRKHKPRVKLPEDEAPSIAPVVYNTDGAAFDAAIPVEERRTLLELTSFTCRWPCGDPSTADFYFCGGFADISTPYCKQHTMRAIRR